MPALPVYVRILAEGYAEEIEPRTLTAKFEVGPVQHLEIMSNDVVFRPVVLLVPGVNYAAFNAWRINDIAGGGGWWDWTDPVDLVLKQARFKDGKLGRAVPTNSQRTHWKIPAVIETWG